MARFTRLQVAQALHEQGLLPLFYHPDFEVCKNVLVACWRGGSRLLEFTNRGDFAHEVFAELNKFAAREMPGMMLGAGSVPDAGTAALYLQLGANFIVSPTLREDVALVCNRRKVLWMPGCSSPTEIATAEELGCEIIKLFPGEVFGAAFVKALRAPQPWTSIMPSGLSDTSKEALKSWFDAGVACVGMGSQLISKEILEGGDFEKLEAKVRETLAVIQEVRR